MPKSASRSLCCGGIFDWDKATRRLDELNALSEDPALWNDSSKAQKLMRERTQLERNVEGCRSLERQLEDAIGLIELAELEGDDALVAEAEQSLYIVQAEAAQKELESLLSGEVDGNDCYLEVNAGAGGTEAQDWAQMLLRMYMRWADKKGYKVELLDETEGDGAGIKSSTIQISGPNAYGWLKTEAGVHRLVRISPFDANARRQERN